MRFFTFLSIALLVSFFSSAQSTLPIDSLTKKVTYSAVVESIGEKDVLFDKALEWFALSFKSAKDVVQIKDKSAGKLVGSFTIYSSEAGPVSANIIVLVKDNKYKYSITDLVFNGSRNYKPWALEEDPNPWSVGLMKKGIRFIKDNTNVRALALVESLKTNMKKPSISENF